MSWIEWEYYSSLFDNITDAKTFEKIRTKAEAYMNRYTHTRAGSFMAAYDEDSATDFQKMKAESVKMTLCELINNMEVQEASEMGMGLASVSNDGYSESYKITTSEEKEAQLACIIRSGLSGTGLAGAL